MRLAYRWSVALVLFTTSTGFAQPARVNRESWDAAHLQGHPAGYVHTTFREVNENGQTIVRSSMELQLTVRRERDTVTLRMETGTDETPDGKVTAVSMRQYLGKQQQVVVTGTVEGNQLHVQGDGGARFDKRIPWDARVIGMYRQETLFKDRAIQPGDSVKYLSYEPTITSVVAVQATAKDYEDVEVQGGKKRLLRVESVPDKIKTSGGAFQLPTMVLWLDKDYQVVRSQVEMPELGRLVLYRTDKAVAKRPVVGGRLASINSLVPINRRINRPYDVESAVYRITVKDDDDPASAFVQDARQQVKNVHGHTFELHVQASRDLPAPLEAKEPGPEYLKSCYFIKCDDGRVRERTRRAIGQETDPWQKALRIEKYVYENIDKKNFTEAFATADEVAKNMEGDCTEHSMLSAAMCRAAGVPSRTALGLVYVDHPNKGPVMGFHMWTEVWVDGQWVPIDATLGRGYVGATHLKITDHSWYDTQSLKPLLPVLRVLGKLSIEVVQVGSARD
jgi:Transglutaminase-like superfamily